MLNSSRLTYSFATSCRAPKALSRQFRYAAALLIVISAPSSTVASKNDWRHVGRDAFIDFLLAVGCEECPQLLSDKLPSTDLPFQLSSQHFGCADIDVLLPSLHWVYEAAKRRLGNDFPGFLVDGGANVGRATARWISALGDSFGRRTARNTTWQPCIICAGAEATAGGGAVAAGASPPTLVVIAVEPSERNFALLQKHASEGNWADEGFLALNAALGAEKGEASLAISEDFAVDEVATLLFKPNDERARQQVRVVTLEDVVTTARRVFFPHADVSAPSIFLLKLDIEGMEPTVLRSLANQRVPVKFVSFEYAGNIWQEPLEGVIADLYKLSFFCFLITADRLFPVSGPFWDYVYRVPVWSNFFCGLEGDPDLEVVVQLHAGTVGIWPAMPGYYLVDFADGDATHYTLHQAQQKCTELNTRCSGVTCECPRGGCAGPGVLPPSAYRGTGIRLGPCTVREGVGGARRSPNNEVTFLRDLAAGDPFLAYRRQAIPSEAPVWSVWVDNGWTGNVKT